LDEQVVCRQVEVGAESLHRVALAVTLEHERAGLVLPLDPVEVEELAELPLGVVREARPLVPLRTGVLELGQDHPPPLAAFAGAVSFSAGPAGRSSWMALSSWSTTGPRATMLITPWPLRMRSIISPSLRAST